VLRIPALWNKAVASCFGNDTAIAEVWFFLSKKNQVSLLELTGTEGIPKQVIAKMFCWGNIAHEAKILKGAADLKLKVPCLLGKYKNILLMQYLEGVTLKSLLARHPDNATALISALGSWLAQWHRAWQKDKHTVLLKGDLRLQNFIVKKGVVFGVDFEESCWGNPLQDLAEMTATVKLFFRNQPELKTQVQTLHNSYREIFPIEMKTLPNLIKIALQQRERFHKFHVSHMS
jgi:tRNA A-37 threonylcarbamoyl transferase component Bud32